MSKFGRRTGSFTAHIIRPGKSLEGLCRALLDFTVMDSSVDSRMFTLCGNCRVINIKEEE